MFVPFPVIETLIKDPERSSRAGDRADCRIALTLAHFASRAIQDHEIAIPGVSPQDTGGQKINKVSGGAWSDAGRVLKIYEGEETE